MNTRSILMTLGLTLQLLLAPLAGASGIGWPGHGAPFGGDCCCTAVPRPAEAAAPAAEVEPAGCCSSSSESQPVPAAPRSEGDCDCQATPDPDPVAPDPVRAGLLPAHVGLVRPAPLAPPAPAPNAHRGSLRAPVPRAGPPLRLLNRVLRL